MVFAVGLMSGTSLDGIDAALVEISGQNEDTSVKLVEFITLPFKDETLKHIRGCLSLENSDVSKICSLNFELGEEFADAVIAVCQKADVALEDLNFIASHGQTLFHIPISRGELTASTLQVGDPAIIAERTRTNVVSNFRERDMAVGGQGAPIVPYSEYLLFKKVGVTRLLQNIGGIGNVTIIPNSGEIDDIIAFDTGPGNVILNELCRFFYQEEYDLNGNHAKQGTINEELLRTLMEHPYIKKKYPKTTGREDFGQQFTMDLLNKWTLSSEDWLATLTMFTAKSIATAVKPFINGATEMIVGGGGSYNPVLLNMLKFELPCVDIKTHEELGSSSEAKEAIAMTILANQTLHHQVGNVPTSTGATKSVPLGRITFY